MRGWFRSEVKCASTLRAARADLVGVLYHLCFCSRLCRRGYRLLEYTRVRVWIGGCECVTFASRQSGMDVT